MSVSSVAVTSPPITTMASGRWISEPGPEEQRDEAEGGDARGHQHRAQAPCGALAHRLMQRDAAFAQLTEIADHDEPVEHRDAEQRDEADRGGNRQIFAR